MRDEFEFIIDSKLSEDEKVVHGSYSIPKHGGSIILDDRDVSSFSKLFYEKSNKHGIGHGEISLYWLFNYAHSSTANKYHSVDLFITDEESTDFLVEVKSFENPYGWINIGNWSKDKVSRRILNYIFSFSNMFGDQDEDYRFKTEYYFKPIHVIESLEEMIYIRQWVMDTSPMVRKDRINNVFDDLRLLNKGNPIKDAKTGAFVLFRNIVENKLRDKPGDKGYICNIKKDKTGGFLIDFFHIDLARLNKDPDKFLENVMVDSGILKLGIHSIFSQPE